MANSVDPDQMPSSAASDLDRRRLQVFLLIFLFELTFNAQSFPHMGGVMRKRV